MNGVTIVVCPREPTRCIFRAELRNLSHTRPEIAHFCRGVCYALLDSRFSAAGDRRCSIWRFGYIRRRIHNRPNLVRSIPGVVFCELHNGGRTATPLARQFAGAQKQSVGVGAPPMDS